MSAARPASMSQAPSLPAAGRLWRFYAIAAATFLPALAFYYVGEEAIFPISSLEMWYHGEWVEQRFYGASLKHNPLYNWLIIPLASLAGWEHVLPVARSIAIAATIGTGLVLAWLCQALYRDAAFAAFAALVYLTLADLFFYRGWLAYADPLFAFFVFGAIACLWVACERRAAALLVLAVALLTGAFMTKALTAYVFYGAAALVLVTAKRDYRAFLLAPASWAAHLAGAALPLAWLYFVPDNAGQGARMFTEILVKLAPTSWAAYFLKLFTYPLDTAARLAPALFVAGWYAWRGAAPAGAARDGHRRVALGILLVNYLPYWLAPQSSMRYLLPLYPLAGFAIAGWLWGAGARAIRVTQRWLIGAIVVKLVAVLALFPYYQAHYRGKNYATTARQIVERAAGRPLYTANDTASGLSVTAEIDVLRLPGPPLALPPARWDSGFVIAHRPEPALGRVAAEYRLGGSTLYLLCRGAACDKALP
jgi:4-amino-4-deoxy-L-arabinose transferase-like glycosyltransferase